MSDASGGGGGGVRSHSNTAGTAIFYTLFVGIAALMLLWIVAKKCRRNRHSARHASALASQSLNVSIPHAEEPNPGVAVVPLQWPPPDPTQNQPQTINDIENQESRSSPESHSNPSRFDRFKKMFGQRQPPAAAIELQPPPIDQLAEHPINQPPPTVPPPSYIDTIQAQKFAALKISIPLNKPNHLSANQQISEPSYVRSPSRSPTVVEFDREYVDPPSYAKHVQIHQPSHQSHQQSSHHLPDTSNQPMGRSISSPDAQSIDDEIVSPHDYVIQISVDQPSIR